MSIGHPLVTFLVVYQNNFEKYFNMTSQYQQVKTFNNQFQRHCSGHPVKLQVIKTQSLAIFTLSPYQRGVNQIRANTPF